VALKYTNPSKLAIEGGSNGGLLMGATLTQHPELMRAVVSHVGIYDMLRVELDPNGAFNTTEYGSVTNSEQFRALYGYSPYHHVVTRTAYPSILMMTGENDGRVNPAHSRKMIARLQAATSSKNPILLRTSSNSGHGIGTALNEQIQQLADVYAFLCDQLGIDYTLIDRGPWSGAITPTAAVVKVKLIRDGLRVRLAVSKNPKLSDPIHFGPALSDPARFDVVEFHADGLESATQYYYGVRKRAGEFKTFPKAGPASFTIAFASCGRTGSTLNTFDRIRENHPLMFLHMGDFHYLDIHTNDPTAFAAAYNSVLASPQQADLYRTVPITYVWDDHDFAGNNSNGRTPAHPAAMRAFDAHVPHYPLVFPGPSGSVNQSFAIGRVKFIMTDLRSQRDDSRKRDGPDKTAMGPRQKEWFKSELLAANGKFPLICWVSSDPWLGQPRTNYYHWVRTNQYGYIHHTNYLDRIETRTNRNVVADDHWSVYATERRDIADFIKNNHIQGVCILHGDSHMLAADDGSHSDFATGGGAPMPIMCAAPLDQAASIKGGYYSQGVYRVRPGEGAFGLLTVTDLNDHIDVAFSGRNNRNEEKISLKFSVPAQPVSHP
jgi:phosphodiesterase/alkaline phosphatase D-like protein